MYLLLKLIFVDGRARNLTSSRKTDKEVVHAFLHTEKYGNKKLKLLYKTLVKGKKSFFEPICKAMLKTGNEKKKKVLEHLSSALKEDCQAFWITC